jgi:alpha-galactosidase
MSKISRRRILELAVAAPALAAGANILKGQNAVERPFDRSSLARSKSSVVTVENRTSPELHVVRRWVGDLCHSKLVNNGRDAVKVKEVVLFDLELNLPPSTRLYGEGFQMLSQTGGTLGRPDDLGNYTDLKHYRLPVPAGAKAFYGMMMLTPLQGMNHLLAFTSCRRFMGQFYLKDQSLQTRRDSRLNLVRNGDWKSLLFKLAHIVSNCSRNLQRALLRTIPRCVFRNHQPAGVPGIALDHESPLSRFSITWTSLRNTHRVFVTYK